MIANTVLSEGRSIFRRPFWCCRCLSANTPLVAAEISEGWGKISGGHNVNLQHTKSEMQRIFGKALVLWALVRVCLSALVTECVNPWGWAAVLRMCSAPAFPFPRGSEIGADGFWGFPAVTVQDFNFPAVQRSMSLMRPWWQDVSTGLRYFHG